MQLTTAFKLNDYDVVRCGTSCTNGVQFRHELSVIPEK